MSAVSLYWCGDCDAWYSYHCNLSTHHQAEPHPVEFVRLRDVVEALSGHPADHTFDAREIILLRFGGGS